ncbi:DsbA family oxidoreductase [Paenibacillus pasadenensis]|uniref:DsbA family oxidoreductase n=1 Tax=Paenibacillus pasadenensis TaxID=217090 RepID=UPI00203F1828|nr:DsbA family oxidoreductase [Paenibacillus pasadenensis]MCM3747635.1 DsbA family oxidoreductase [Paenibacillus pasadenensis]
MLIEIYHDLLCPWCRMGRKHLELALQQWQPPSGQEAVVRHSPFLLHPDVPPEGLPFRETMAARSGGTAPMRRTQRHVAKDGQAIGLEFRFERINLLPSTRLAHQALSLTPALDQGAFIDELCRRYFEEGENIGDIEIIAAASAAAGWQPRVLRERLSYGDGKVEIEAQLELGRRLGMDGVPLFIFEGQYALSGAYPHPELLLLLRRLGQLMS